MKKSELKKQKAKFKNQRVDESKSGEDDQDQVKQDQDQIKGEVKIENQDGPKRWYEDSQMEIDDKNKWTYLQHHGVIFPQSYIPKNLCANYDGQEVPLTPLQQELVWYWCQTIDTDWQQNSIYRNNFQTQFMERFRKEKSKYDSFNKFDFRKIKQFQKKYNADNKNQTDQQKLKIKKYKEQLNKNYGYAIVDDIVQKINGFVIQPPTLFKGRGKHPKAGILKPRIQPQDIILNLASNAPIPKCPNPGHSWKEIVSKNDSTWLCSYINDAINDSSRHKYIFLAPNSRFKCQNDRRKYQKARKLKGCINEIRSDYIKKMESGDMRNKQLGTATYLIDTLALRVGNQKGQDQADTVGCCSLRVQHIDVIQNNQIKLDFLGKDSMRYQNTVTVSSLVWKNISSFIHKKQATQDLFDKIDAQSLNDYLKSQMEGLTAKVFRTYNASITLQNQLKKEDLTGLTMEEKVDRYEAANKQVAILCNHQKTPSKKLVQGLVKRQHFIQAEKTYLKQLEKHKNQFTKKDKIQREPETVEIQGAKPLIKKFPQTKELTISTIKKLEQKIAKQQKNLRKKDQGKQIALGTSKTNYNDPRISIAWCKKNEVKIQKIFTKNLLSKFLWGMYTQSDWQF